jgi:hypothetical protein
VTIPVLLDAPELLDERALMHHLGIKQHTAGRIMRHCPRTRIGRKLFVAREDVRRFLADQTVHARGPA